MSLRARLALVLAGVLAGPLAAAGLVVGVVVPHVRADADRAALTRAASTASAYLAQECVALGDLARGTALDLAASVAAGRAVDEARARAAAATAVRGHDAVGLFVLLDGRPVARAGALPAAPDPAGGDQALPAQSLASCSRGSAPADEPAALVESVPVPVGAGGPVLRVLAVRSLDTGALAQLRSRLGLDADLAVLPRGRAPGTDRRHEVAPPVAGVPYRVVASAPAGPPDPVRVLLVAVAIVAALACAVLLAVVTARLTTPLRRLTAAAARLRAGDLGVRTGLTGDGEVGELAATLDDMAVRLQAREEELRRTRAAEADAAARFGEALERTHDLDGLLHTVLEAGCAAVAAAAGSALLGTERTLEERGTLEVGDVPVPARASAWLARLARRALADGRPLTATPAEAGAPVLAVPLRTPHRALGALAVARAPGEPPFGPGDVEVLHDLARHAAAAVANALAHEETLRLSVTDPLTGAGNFRQLSTTLAREVERATRFNRPLSVVMLDLDHFKTVNDTHGHPFGDGVLREFARRLQDCLREVDTVTRYGGEEFTVVLPETGADGAAAVAGRIVRAVRDRPFTVGSRSSEVTVSAGVASFPDHGRTASEILRAADAALYAAKAAGRDRWCLAEVAVPGAPGDDLLDETLDESLGGTLHETGAVEGVGAARPGRGG